MVNLTNKRSFVHKARRERQDEVDLMRRNKLKNFLFAKFGIRTVGLIPNIYMRDRETNEVIISSVVETDLSKAELWEKYEININDLYCRSLNTLFEIDGGYHGDGPDSPITASDQTTKRNENYNKGGFKEDDGTLVIITNEDLELPDDELEALLRKKMNPQK